MHTTDGIVYYCAAPEPGDKRKLVMQILKRGFAEFFDMDFAQENIKRSSYGKPYYEGGGEWMQFNISHCRGAVAVAVSHQRIGVDVEGMRSVNYRTAVKCCSSEELSYVLGIDTNSASTTLQLHDAEKNYEIFLPENRMSDEEVKRFLQLWTLKESYVKMTGEGLRKKLNQVNFALQDTQGIWERSVQTVAGNQAKSSHFLYSPGNYVLALTVETRKTSAKAEFFWKEYQLEMESKSE